MKNFLFLKSSVLQQYSVSNQLIDEAFADVQGNKELISLDELNIPELSVANFAKLNDETSAERAFQKEQIAKLKEKQVVVIGAPMYNFSTSVQLKKYIDLISKAGETFNYTENGPVGYLKAEHLVIVTSRGGAYHENGIDFFEQYLKMSFGFLGVKNIHFIYAEKMAYGDEVKNQSINQARKDLKELLASF